MKTLKWIVVIAVLAPIVLTIGFYIRNKLIGPEGWAMDDTIKLLKLQMKDPDSMEIRSSYIVRKPAGNGQEHLYICGIVDGKNSFGGYSGGSRFVSRSSVSEDSYNMISVQIESVEDIALSKDVGAKSAFERAYWSQGCI
jgi:hypothetical protein